MSHHLIEIIEDYNNRYHTNIDAEGMMASISSLLIAHNNAETRDEMLKKYLMESYSEMAAQYQYDKMSKQIRGENIAGYTATPHGLLGEYLAVFNIVVNSVSEQRLEDARQAKIEAKAATERANQALEDAIIAYNNSLLNDRARSRELKAEYERLEQKYQAAKANENNVFTFTKYTPTMNNLALGSNDVKSLMENQLESFTYSDYRDFRRHQIKTLGVRSSVFASELPNTNQNLKFSDLNLQGKQKIMDTWVTKQLMQEELDSRSWFSKNIWNRREAKAMREYIARANVVLSEANHYMDNDQFEQILNNMMSKSYETLDDNTVGHEMSKFAANFQSNDEPLRALEEKKKRIAAENRMREEREKQEAAKRKIENQQQKDNDKKRADEQEAQKTQWEAKKEAFQTAINAINEKNKANEEALKGQSLYQRLQDPKFMPSFNPGTHFDEGRAINAVGKILKQQNATVALSVLMKNAEKLKLMHTFKKMVDKKEGEAQAFIDKANEVYEGCKKIEAEQEKIAADPNYAKVENVEELIAAAEKEKQLAKNANNAPKKESVHIDAKQIDGDQPQELSPPHKENTVSKEPMAKK